MTRYLNRLVRRRTSTLADAAGPHVRTVGLAVVSAVAALAVLIASGSAGAKLGDGGPSPVPSAAAPDGLGITPQKIKHVWLIILENKSYDASFTGLNNNTYLWQTLPSQGVLLRNYYGTGHFSLDNYISLVSGQATQPDTQADCPDYDAFSGSLSTTGSLQSNPNFGQLVSAAGANAAPGANGCVYPSTVQTLFNQFDAAHVSWKGYAQDLTLAQADSPQHSAGVQYCGAPFASPGATGSTAEPNPGSADAADQYVAKHFPFPWFESLLSNPADCDAAHIADLFDSSNGLYHDLQSEATTPAFSWISPNNCSDAHDAVCKGNNLSGGFSDPNTPNDPKNHTGGLYAADLFLEHVIPEIEASPAFKDGGLIDVTFDEGFPPFTYTGNSFANSSTEPANAATALASDAAGETIFGRTVHSEPTGPNTPLETDASGNQLFPGPGFNGFIDRPSTCVSQTVPPQPAGTCILGFGNHSPGARTDAGASAGAGVATIRDDAVVATDVGRSVTGAGIPSGAFVGHVTDAPNAPDIPAGGPAVSGFFTIVDSSGNVLTTTGAVSGVTLGAETSASDPLYDAKDPTPGGGDTGSVLISKFIHPGTASDVYYNHYSWLRTMEDIFNVSHASPGLDGLGHLGYAAQPGLAPFGLDVFNDPLGLH
jgi:Phosphoesterase family